MVPKLFVCFPFFPLLLLFQQAVAGNNEKFGLNSASRNGLIERETITLEYQQLWPKERNRREKPQNRYVAELLAREETLSHLLLPFFFARLNMLIYI